MLRLRLTFLRLSARVLGSLYDWTVRQLRAAERARVSPAPDWFSAEAHTQQPAPPQHWVDHVRVQPPAHWLATVRTRAPHLLEHMPSYSAPPPEAVAVTYGQPTALPAAPRPAAVPARSARAVVRPPQPAPPPLTQPDVSIHAAHAQPDAALPLPPAHARPASLPVTVSSTQVPDAPALKPTPTRARGSAPVLWMSSPQAAPQPTAAAPVRARAEASAPAAPMVAAAPPAQPPDWAALPDVQRTQRPPAAENVPAPRAPLAAVPLTTTRADWPSLLADEPPPSADTTAELRRHRARLDHEQRGTPCSE